jgi:hypothetical protein
MSQLHKRLTDQQVKDLIERYLKNEIERKYVQEVLGVRKVRFSHKNKNISPKGNEMFLKQRMAARLGFRPKASL